MLSPRRTANAGLAAAAVVACACVAVLAAGASGDQRRLAGYPGSDAPDFALPDAAAPAGARAVRLADYRGSVVVAYFCSIRCPASNAYHERVAELAARYGTGGRVRFVAIHTGGGAAAPDEVAVQSAAAGLRFPHLLDADGSVARRYVVTRTPTFLVIDPSGEVRYRGALDDNPHRALVTRGHLDDAIRAVLGGHDVERPMSEVGGCAVR